MVYEAPVHLKAGVFCIVRQKAEGRRQKAEGRRKNLTLSESSASLTAIRHLRSFQLSVISYQYL
ncbi:MAG: hypothetical protein F6K48_01990 [Okeania sp. SIO3H1]|nr:hypothetical protein [Okeania sp. SIO3H1]